MKTLTRCLLAVFSLLFLQLSRIEAENPAVSIGIILPLTGRAAEAGVAAKNGLLLAQEQSPKILAQANFIIEDTAYDSSASVTAFQKMVDRDGVKAVLVLGHGPASAIAPIAEAKHIPLFALSGDPSISLGKEYVVRFWTSHEKFAESLLSALRAKGVKHIGIVKSDLAYMNATVDCLKRQIDNSESLDIVDSFSIDASDFRSTITKIKTKTIEALGVFLSEEQIPTFFRQAHELELQLPIFGIHSFGSNSSRAAIQTNYPGSFYPAIAVEDSFRKSYVARWHDDAQLPFAASSYDFANLVVGLLDKHTAISSHELIKSFREISEVSGASGKFKPDYDSKLGTRVEFPIEIITVGGNELNER